MAGHYDNEKSVPTYFLVAVSVSVGGRTIGQQAWLLDGPTTRRRCRICESVQSRRLIRASQGNVSELLSIGDVFLAFFATHGTQCSPLSRHRNAAVAIQSERGASQTIPRSLTDIPGDMLCTRAHESAITSCWGVEATLEHIREMSDYGEVPHRSTYVLSPRPLTVEILAIPSCGALRVK